MLYSRTIETPIGEMLACATVDGICLIIFFDNPEFPAELEKLSNPFKAGIEKQANDSIDLLEIQLKEYFEGERKIFTVPLCLAGKRK
jgi:O6-methylguanine-DNA--protein-cysteine methyltransferase